MKLKFQIVTLNQGVKQAGAAPTAPGAVRPRGVSEAVATLTLALVPPTKADPTLGGLLSKIGGKAILSFDGIPVACVKGLALGDIFEIDIPCLAAQAPAAIKKETGTEEELRQKADAEV